MIAGSQAGQGFQSLFWWRGHLDLGSVHVIQLHVKFQSLFWWRGHLDESASIHDLVAYMFQSLFWWRGHLDNLFGDDHTLL